MLPSRGLRWSSQAGGLCRRRIESSAIRQFSSNISNRPIRSNSTLSKNGISFSKSITRSQFPSTNSLLRNAASIRFASTIPPTSTAPPPDSTFISTSLDSATDFQSDLFNIPEHIGYLKELGLDYGWGPTAIMEWTLEHVHIFTGTPWWASIVIAAAVWRVILAKPFLDAAENASRMAAIKHITAPIQARMTAASRAGQTAEMMEARQELSLIYRRAGISMWKSFTPMMQIFVGFGTWRILHAMAHLPVPGLLDGGILWFYNLTIPDPLFILPAATAGILHMVLRRGGETGVNNLSPAMLSFMMWGMPFMSFACTIFMPAGLQLSFFVSSCLSAIQGTIFRNSAFRRWANMTPLPEPSKPSTMNASYKIIENDAQDPAKKKTVMDGTVGSVMSGFKSAVAPMVNKATEQQNRSRAKREKEEAERYEKMAQKREHEARRARAAERASKRASK